MKQQGTRRDIGEGELLEPLEYGLSQGKWRACAPNGMLANLDKHQVFEHKDKTITVSPSILVGNGEESWHGFLVKGEWETSN